MAEFINEIRYFHFISGVLVHQQADPLCSKCKAFANTAERMKEAISELESVHGEKMHTLSPDLLSMLEDARDRMERIRPPVDAVDRRRPATAECPKASVS